MLSENGNNVSMLTSSNSFYVYMQSIWESIFKSNLQRDCFRRYRITEFMLNNIIYGSHIMRWQTSHDVE